MNKKIAIILSQQEFIETSKSFFIDSDYQTAFGNSGLTSIDAIFSFNTGKDPGGSHLPKYRSRLQFDISDPVKILFLKRYDNPDIRTQLANWLITNYNATVVLSVGPERLEKQIAEEICNSSRHQLINLAETPISLGELKALFSIADLVISNDTGPRHIAIAFKRKLITLFGPNDPAWTNTDYENEIQIVGNVACAPCTRPICRKSQHLCMQAITVEMVCNAAKELLDKGQ